MPLIRIYINWSSLFHPLKSGGVLHPLKNLYKRYKYGAGCCDVYSLYDYLSKIIAPALRRFKETSHGHPMAYVNDRTKEEMTQEKWDDIIDMMIYAFDSVEKDNRGEKIDYKKRQKGFELFGKWFTSLWF